MKEDNQNHRIDPELEARIVALVLGEASDLDRDQMLQILEVRPELAAFKAEIESVHELMREVAMDELPAKDEVWRLSVEKRGAVLAVISPEVERQPAMTQVSVPSSKNSPPKVFNLLSFAKIAAVFCIVGFFGVLAMPMLGLRSREFASKRAPALAAGDAWSEYAASSAMVANSDGTNASVIGTNAKVIDERLFSHAMSAATAESVVEQSPKSAMSAIRGSLNNQAVAATPNVNSDPVRNFQVPAGSGSKLSLETLSLPKLGDLESEVRAAIQPSVVPGTWELNASPSSSLDDFRSRYRAMNTSESSQTQSSFGNQFSDLARRGEASGKTMDFGTSVDDVSGLRTAVDAKNGQQQSDSVKGWMDLARPRVERKSESSSENRSDFESQQSGPEQPSSQTTPALGGGTTLRFSGEAKESSARGVASGIDKSVAFDNGMIGKTLRGGYGGGAITEDGRGRQSIAAGNKPRAATEQDLGDRFKIEQQQRATATPEVAGKKIALEEKPAEVAAAVELSDFSSPSSSKPSPTNQPMSGPEGREQLSDLAAILTDGEEVAKQPAITPSNGNLANNHGVILNVTPRIIIGEDEEIAKQDFLLSDAGAVVLGRTFRAKTIAPFQKVIAPAGLHELSAADDAFSTFSLHVSDVSFKLALAALAQGEWPEAAKVRIEEFVNAIDYGDPLPGQGENVACRLEQSIHPFLQQRNLLRVSMRTSAAGRASHTPLRLTLLLDNSGSMERIDRQQTVRRAFAMLAGQLQSIDQVTLISFARQPRLLADKVSGAQSIQLVQLIENLPSEGGTNIEAALQLAFEKAREQQTEGAQNRIVLLTDGAVNLGDANPESLLRMVTTMRDAGIAFDAAGIGAEGLNDEVLEALTRKGDGRYYLLDSVEAADGGFARQIAGALRPSAKNVKVQVEFNPNRVGRYKLLGFEKHLLKQEDFRNDQVDAAEMAEAGVGIYQFEVRPEGAGDVGSVSVRFRDLSTGEMVENRWPIPYETDAARAERAAPSMRIATCAALFAAKLRGEPLGETVDLKMLSELLSSMPEQHRSAKRVQQLHRMIEQARSHE